jgi:hypothetical protein
VSKEALGVLRGETASSALPVAYRRLSRLSTDLVQKTLDLREDLPTFMCAVQVHILDDAQEGGRGWLENALPLEMAVEELPLAPYRRP